MEKKKFFLINWIKFSTIREIIFFPALFVYLELVFRIYCYKSISVEIISVILFAMAYGMAAFILTSVWKPLINKIAGWVITGLTVIAFNLQLVYSHIFKTYISIYSVQQNAGDATEFFVEALHGIWECMPGVVLMLIIPLLSLFLCIKRKLVCIRRKNIKALLLLGTGSIVMYILAVVTLPIGGSSTHTAYDLYHNNWMLDLGIEKLGVLTSASLDIKSVILGDEESIQLDEAVGLSDLVIETVPTPVARVTEAASISPTPVIPVSASSITDPSESVKLTATPIPSPTPTPIDTSPNIMDIDFEGLAETEKDKDIISLHKYMAAAEPTKKNKYTGMFEGYNLIYMVAEGFSPWAVDKDVTPTLYRLVNEGFVFKNFYTPIWYTSTSDGEYVACTGLIPYSTNSFKRSKKNELPFCMGNQFVRLGCMSRAWHAHTTTYYGRKETHPNMGYVFKGKYDGLAITDVWPESDLEMMQLTVPEYINDERFHTYYMTVSGHLEYSFSGNTQAKKNKSYVENLPYSDAVKAYIACNKEFDLALEYLIEELEKAGVADKTVIAFSADHYPYGLTDGQINEVAGHEVEKNFELYKNHFVLWSPSIKEPIEVEKYCSSLDIIPTISNLFGLEYDSRLLMGSDILSDSPALVIFSNQSFITDYCKYNSKTKEITVFEGVQLPEGYIEEVNKIVRNKFEISKKILLKDYYSYLHLSEQWKTDEGEQDTTGN